MTTSGARCASPSAAALGLGRRPALARRPSRSVPPRHHGVPRKTASWQSRVSLNQVRAAESSSVSLLDNQDAVNDCIDLILEEIQGTDFGAKVPDDKRAKIDGAIEILIELSSKQSSPLDNDALFKVYNVAYSSAGPDQNGAPAGGRFRGRLGRFLFRTTGLYQAILRPNLAKNLVTFMLFGLIPGSIGLAGTFVKVSSRTVKVVFERPRFTLLGQTFAFGPKSSVELLTPAFYAGKLRIGKGTRGSLFVFTVDDKSQSPEVMREMERVPTKRAWLLVAAFLGLLGSGLFLLQRALGSKPLLAAVGLLLLAGSVLKKGGIVDDSQSEIKEDS